MDLIEILVIVLIMVTVYLVFIKKRKPKLEDVIDITRVYEYNIFEIELMKLINEHRASLSLSELTPIDYVSFLCKDHNEYMIEKGKISHDLFNERVNKIEKVLKTRLIGENVAYNFLSPKSTLNAWLKSESHKKNIENPKWNSFGISHKDKFSTNVFVKIN